MEAISFSDFVGMIGTIAVGLAYLATQLRKMNSSDLAFPLINLVGSFFIIYSLMHNFNLASMVMEIFWIIVSAIGIYQWHKAKSN